LEKTKEQTHILVRQLKPRFGEEWTKVKFIGDLTSSINRFHWTTFNFNPDFSLRYPYTSVVYHFAVFETKGILKKILNTVTSISPFYANKVSRQTDLPLDVEWVCANLNRGLGLETPFSYPDLMLDMGKTTLTLTW